MPQIPILSGIGKQPDLRYTFWMESRFYVYCHLRADTGEVFYIGKGKGRRAYSDKPYHRSQWWCRTVEKAGGFTVRFLHEGLSEERAFALEVEEIARHREGGASLVNLTNGGDGTAGLVRSPEWCAMMSAVHKGKVLSEETKRKISESVRNSGYVITEEARRKISETHKGQKRSLGYRHTEEWKAKQKEWTKGNKGRLGQKRSAEERAKASASLSGRKQTVITCPHCGKSGGNIMRRYHFDNCKALINEPI